MSGATRLLLHVYPWLPLGFLLEVAAFHLLFLRAKRRNRDAPAPEVPE